MNTNLKKVKIGTCIICLIILYLSIYNCGIPCSDQKFKRAGVEDSANVIEICMSGAEFYGGINPITKLNKTIKGNGEIVIERANLFTGDRKEVKHISKTEVKNLADFIVKSGFFQMNDFYDCAEDDSKCEARKHKYPPATPITLSVTVGDVYKEVTVTVCFYRAYGADAFRKFIDYPDEFDIILNKIDAVVYSDTDK